MEQQTAKPIILGADEQSATQDKNINTQEVKNPNTSGVPADFFEKLSPQAKEYFMEKTMETNREQLREEIIAKGRTELADDDYTLYKRPRKGCSKCSGEGRVGWSSDKGEVILCDCMRRGKLMDASPDEFMNAADLMKILTVSKPVYPRDHIRPKSLRRAMKCKK